MLKPLVFWVILLLQSNLILICLPSACTWVHCSLSFVLLFCQIGLIVTIAKDWKHPNLHLPGLVELTVVHSGYRATARNWGLALQIALLCSSQDMLNEKIMWRKVCVASYYLRRGWGVEHLHISALCKKWKNIIFKNGYLWGRNGSYASLNFLV